jgi:septum formation protein
VDIARQYFAPIPFNVIEELIQQGTVYHCCGGFMIDDPLLMPYLREREGDEDSIIGLALRVLADMIKEVS